jgi:osmotically-inducible protein OsmY
VRDPENTTLKAPASKNLCNVRVNTAAGVVIMNGSLASEEEKRLALFDAWYVPGVSDVVDRIETRD